MAEDSGDRSQKTEEPTQKKLEEAKRKGQVAASREVNHWFMILGAAVVVMTFVPAAMGHMQTVLKRFIAQAHAIPVDAGAIRAAVGRLLADLAPAMLGPVVVLVLAALAGGLIQNGLVIAPDRIKPKIEKISPMSGFRRLFSLKSTAEFLKGVLKIVIVGGVVTMLVWPEIGGIERLVWFDMESTMAVLYALVLRVLIGVVAVLTVIAALDFLYQKLEHTRSMRMSRQEVRDELKQTEGDPVVRARLRQIRQERARRRMMAAVPDASVVITNPTHFAVALKYDLNAMNAPVLVAKGADTLAFRIRKIAEENGVPVVENPPLARALHAGVDIDQEIPAEHYRAVAEIIGYVMRLKGELPPERPAAR